MNFVSFIFGEMSRGCWIETNRVVMSNRWVRTEMGQDFADSFGFKEPPLTLEESVRGLLEQVSFSL